MASTDGPQSGSQTVLNHLGSFQDLLTGSLSRNWLPARFLAGWQRSTAASVRERGREGGRRGGRRGGGKEWGGRRSGWLLWSPGWGSRGSTLIPRITMGLTCLIGLSSGRPWGVCVHECARVCTCVGRCVLQGPPGMGGSTGSCELICVSVCGSLWALAPFPVYVCISVGLVSDLVSVHVCVRGLSALISVSVSERVCLGPWLGVGVGGSVGLHMGIESVAHTQPSLFSVVQRGTCACEQPRRWRHHLTWRLVPPGEARRHQQGSQDPA